MRAVFIVIGTIINLLFIHATVIGQRNLNDAIKNLSNDKVKFEVAKVGIATVVDSNKIALPKNLVFVKSMNVDALLAKVKREQLINALIPLLKDTTKDWYANLMLYQVAQKDASIFIVIATREDWIKRNKERDVKYWNSYLKENGAHKFNKSMHNP